MIVEDRVCPNDNILDDHGADEPNLCAVTTVATLAPANAASAAAVLARALHCDPMMVYLLPDPDRRARLLPRFLGALQRYCLRYGTVMVEQGLSGVACWLPPGATEVSVGRMARTGMLSAAAPLGIGGLRRLLTLTSAMERDHHRGMREPHWYLWLLGTEPSQVRRGIGGALLRPVLARADAEQVPCYLETHSERNLRFYAGHGFAPHVEGVAGGVRYWGLRRLPLPAVT